MKGFGEKGQPDDWDLVVGTVRGYRWWYLCLPFSAYGAIQLRPANDGPPWESANWEWALAKLHPSYRESYVEGMFGGRWSSPKPVTGSDPVFTAYCRSTEPVTEGGHSVPGTDCGCGYWAYWDETGEEYYNSNLPLLRDNTLFLPFFGVIGASGRTVIGSRGFRTQQATVLHGTLHDPWVYNHEKTPEWQPWMVEDGLYSHSSVLLYSGSGRFAQKRMGSVIYEVASMAGVSARAVYEACQSAIRQEFGANFIWHDSVTDLISSVPPDLTYVKDTADG